MFLHCRACMDAAGAEPRGPQGQDAYVEARVRVYV